jgi:hypothetical protein
VPLLVAVLIGHGVNEHHVDLPIDEGLEVGEQILNAIVGRLTRTYSLKGGGKAFRGSCTVSVWLCSLGA